METFCRITMQLPLFELKLKTIPLLYRHDDFVSHVSFVSQVSTLCNHHKMLVNFMLVN